MVRNFTFTRDSFYVYKNTCCVKWIRVKKTKHTSAWSIVINGVKLAPTCIDDRWVTWDFSIIREACRDEIQNNDLIRLDENFRWNTVAAMAHYKNVPLDELDHAVFTSGLQIALYCEGHPPAVIDAQEDVFSSDLQLKNEKPDTH